MSISVSNWVWGHSRSRNAARLVLLSLADTTREPGGWTWPSIAALADRTGLGERSVRRAIAELAGLGELEVQYNAAPGGCNRYRIHPDTPAKLAPPLPNWPPADLAGGDAVSTQASTQTPAKSAPPAKLAPLPNRQDPPARLAPGTIREPKEMSSTKTSKGGTGGRRPKQDPDFERWYADYPVHKGRGDAEKAWAQAMRDGADPDTLIAAAKNYSQEPQVLRGYGKYPASWLRAKCWLDEAAPSPVDRATAQAAAIKARLAAKENHEQG